MWSFGHQGLALSNAKDVSAISQYITVAIIRVNKVEG
jgi:hypothetical protein